MPVRNRSGRTFLLHFGVGCMAAAFSVAAVHAQRDAKDKDVKKPSVAIRVAPPISFSPARVVITAELRGGTVDDPELYCPEVEWDWGDGTKSEATENCEPFEAGKSTIKRRWTTTHTFQTQGTYRVQLRLKRGPRTIASGNNTVQVKAGVRDLSNNPY